MSEQKVGEEGESLGYNFLEPDIKASNGYVTMKRSQKSGFIAIFGIEMGYGVTIDSEGRHEKYVMMARSLETSGCHHIAVG